MPHGASPGYFLWMSCMVQLCGGCLAIHCFYRVGDCFVALDVSLLACMNVVRKFVVIKDPTRLYCSCSRQV